MANDEGWTDPQEEMGLWEYQTHPLTVGDLKEFLEGVPEDASITMNYADNAGKHHELRVMHVDERGPNGRVTSVMFTLA